MRGGSIPPTRTRLDFAAGVSPGGRRHCGGLVVDETKGNAMETICEGLRFDGSAAGVKTAKRAILAAAGAERREGDLTLRELLKIRRAIHLFWNRPIPLAAAAGDDRPTVGALLLEMIDAEVSASGRVLGRDPAADWQWLIDLTREFVPYILDLILSLM